MTGTLSPVSMDSLTIAEPVSNTISHGSVQPSGTSTTSPGTRSELSTTLKSVLHLPKSVKTLNLIGQEYRAILRIELVLEIVSYSPIATDAVDTIRIQAA